MFYSHKGNQKGQEEKAAIEHKAEKREKSFSSRDKGKNTREHQEQGNNIQVTLGMRMGQVNWVVGEFL